MTGPGDIGYEVTNHTAIDADYGNMTDFDDLVAKAHEKGLLQLVDYLEHQEQDKGWLVIFEHRRKKTWSKAPIRKQGKDIFAVWI